MEPLIFLRVAPRSCIIKKVGGEFDLWASSRAIKRVISSTYGGRVLKQWQDSLRTVEVNQ